MDPLSPRSIESHDDNEAVSDLSPLGCDDEEEAAPDPGEGLTLVDARYEYTMWGDDQWLITGYERPDGTWGIYDFMTEEWLEVVPASQKDKANKRVVDSWLEDHFHIASIPTDLLLDGLWRTDIRRLLTRRIAFEDANVDGAVDAAPTPNLYESSDILKVWDGTVDVEHATADAVLTDDQVERHFAAVSEYEVSEFESWLTGWTVRWRDNSEVLTHEEARALLHLCRYIAACCR